MCNQDFPNEQELRTHNQISHPEAGVGKTVGGGQRGTTGTTGGTGGGQTGGGSRTGQNR